MQDNRVKQDWLDSGKLVSTVDIDNPLTRQMDSLMQALASGVPAEVIEEEFPGLTTDATSYKYETMVFPQENGEVTDWAELDCRRYNSLEDALAGHEEMVEKWS